MRELDPGWVLAGAGNRADIGRTGDHRRAALVAARRLFGPRSADIVNRLWRHSVAVGIMAPAARARPAIPIRRPSAGRGSSAAWDGGRWRPFDPEWLASWWRQDDPGLREPMERADLGSDLDDLGRRLAERWGCDPLVVDAAWLHADRGGALNLAAASPGRLAIIQEAYRWAEQTPWSLRGPDRESMPAEPRLRILMAEVQARCGAPFVDPTATPHEERVTRQNARLRLAGRPAPARPGSRRAVPRTAGRVAPGRDARGMGRPRGAWPGAPSRASGPRGSPGSRRKAGPDDGREPRVRGRREATARRGDANAPHLVVPLNDRRPGAGRGRALVPGRWAGAWLRDDAPSTIPCAPGAPGRLLADRSRLERRLQAAVASLRDQVQGEDERLRRRKMDALGEFAAGAGHELNNPLAVIVGRAQLLLARTEDPEVARSLRIILGQAQRAHRILRDLMFVARPPAPRPRAWKPPEVLGLRAVGVRAGMPGAGGPAALGAGRLRRRTPGRSRTDSATSPRSCCATPCRPRRPAGGSIVRSSHKDGELIWSFSDNGKGIGADEGEHLFDPFYCGRQAGRGLGLGLPRAARIVEQAGGKLRWSSGPGQETMFQVHLPLTLDRRRPARRAAAGQQGRPAAASRC